MLQLYKNLINLRNFPLAIHKIDTVCILFQILLYSTDVFHYSGVSNGDIATAIIGLTLLLGTIVTVSLHTHTKLELLVEKISYCVLVNGGRLAVPSR